MPEFPETPDVKCRDTMSFEAVPCRFRSTTGPNGETEYIGLLIRPAGDTGQTPALANVARVGGAPPVTPVRVIPAGDSTPRLLVPANVQVRLATTGDGCAPLPINATWQPSSSRVATFSTPTPHISSPCPQQPRSLSVCSSSPMTASSPMSPPGQLYAQQSTSRCQQNDPTSSRPWQQGNDSSTTPDSGIQSVPGSPPSHHRDSPPTIEACTSVCEERPDEEDFADMPRLIPIDQEDDYCAPGPSGIRDEHSTNGSECETTVPMTLSITPFTDNAKISEQLIQLDPAKAFDIAKEIHKRMGLQTMEKGRKRKNPKKEPRETKKKRPTSAASDEFKKSEEEMKELPTLLPFPSSVSVMVAASSPEVRECPPSPPSSVFTPADSRKLYREALKRMMEKQLSALFEKTTMDVQEMHIGERERHDRRKSKINKLFSIDWEAVKKRKKHENERFWTASKKRTWMAYKTIKKEPKEEEPQFPPKPKKERKRKLTDDEEKARSAAVSPHRLSRMPQRTPSKRRNTMDSSSSFDSIDKDIDYDEIPRSVCEQSLPGWRVPIVRCGCSRGACSSDAECINRALFVQCPSNCQAHLCINKKFWKEDAVRLLNPSGPKTNRILRTKVARRAGDFLGEFSGEIVNFPEAERRWKRYEEEMEEIPRILSLSPTLFIDATKQGNSTRFVRHSCRPTCRLEVWSINGHLRAGLFPLFDLTSNTEITIDMNGLLPVGMLCGSCKSDEKCSRWLKRSRNAAISSAEALPSEEERITKETRIFLLRNRRRTIRMASKSYAPKNSIIPATAKECLQKILDGFQLRIRRVDGSLPFSAIRPYNSVRKAVLSGDVTVFQSAVENLLEKLDDDDLDRVYSALWGHYMGTNESKEKKHHHLRRSIDVDLSYLETMNAVRVGSYNPDSAWPKGAANKRADAVRCECGSLEEDGKMLQCDACNFWLHTDCIGNVDENLKFYQCRLCSGEIPDGIPSTDVKLVKQPEVRLEGCVYYKALTNRREIQVRQFETVYVEKTTSDDHKKILRTLAEINERGGRKKKNAEEKTKETDEQPIIQMRLNPPGHRKDLRIFRVERLFMTPGGYRFVFGFYYARPHETICDPQRQFHRNEVFGTPFYDTLPLDTVVGRCAVLDPDVYVSGRPTVPLFKEEDVLVCDYQIDKQQRSFEKIPARNRFPVNTQPYVFSKYDTPRPLQRDFTPFSISDRSHSRNAGRTSRAESRKEPQTRQQAVARLESVVSRLSPSSPPILKVHEDRRESSIPRRKRKRS